MLKNFEEVKKFLLDIDRPILKDKDLELDEDGHKVYFGGLRKVEKLLSLVDNPEQNLNIIHVAGTAGKGSVCNWLRIFLNKAGYKVGILTSPHITSFIEEIQIDNLFIPEDVFISYINKLMPEIKWMRRHFKAGGPSIYEIIFVISLLYFKDEKCDYVVLEAGMGGKYDATNSISKSIVSIITSISEDHLEMLGDINMITKDKSSIVEKSGLLVSNTKKKSIIDNIDYICKKYDAKHLQPSDSFTKKISKIINNKLNSTLLSNLSLALFTLDKINIQVDLDINDLEKFKLPCRFEMFSEEPLIILDGAHNMSKIKTLFDLLDDNNIKKPIIIFSIFTDKEYESVIEFVSKRASKIILTTISKRGRVSPSLKSMKDIAKKFMDEKDIYSEENNLRAFMLSKTLSDKTKPILVTGSFIHCAKIRELRWNEDKILLSRKII